MEFIALYGDNRPVVDVAMREAGLDCWDNEYLAAVDYVKTGEFESLLLKKRYSIEAA